MNNSTDLPEAVTQGENCQDALFHAADCLEEAIANRIVMGFTIPEPTPLEETLIISCFSY